MSKLSLRNTIAYKGANFLLNHVATNWYRDAIGAIVDAGIKRLLEEEHKAAEKCPNCGCQPKEKYGHRASP